MPPGHRGPGLPTEPDGPLPASFADLHLDAIVERMTAGRGAYDLAPVFREPLGDADAIAYRHAIFRDLEDPAILEPVRAFSTQLQTVQRRLAHAAKAPYMVDRERWHLGAAGLYCASLQELDAALAGAPIRSTGLAGIRAHVAAGIASETFTTLAADERRAAEALHAVSYRLRIHGSRVTVARSRAEPDYGAEVLQTFERFRQGARTARTWQFDQGANMNHVDAAILDRVARLYPEPFAGLRAFAAGHPDFMDPVVVRFEREVQFYLAYLELMGRIRAAGLRFCYPEVTADVRAVEGTGLFDLALAIQLAGDGRTVVANDLALREGERIVVVSGPNQGGKTTFARAIGQVHHLARIGVPVPGERVRLPLVDRIFTHFERREQLEDLRSKLEDDLRRIHDILDVATSSSLLIMNESFSSTTVDDQLFIGRRLMRRIVDRGCVCVVVTFLDELASLDPAVVSMVAAVDPAEPARRTFEIRRHPADGLAYAMAIVERHRLTYPGLKRRLAR